MKQELLSTFRVCLFCIGLAACAGQLRSVPTTTSEDHPANDVSPNDLEVSMGRLQFNKKISLQ